jgi:DNA-binding response OmpR family regulator
MKRTRILIVEDDRDLAAGLCDAFELEGYRVDSVLDGKAGLARALEGGCDLVILDAMLPGLSGFDVLERMRRSSLGIPVLMLTARGQELDKVRGPKLGADDYVTKPFSLMELLARVEALLRRAGRGRAAGRLELGPVAIDLDAREAVKRGVKLALTAREIIEILAARRGQAISRAELIAGIWGTAVDVEVSTRTIDQHVASLRRKLGDSAAEPRLIETVFGFGYRLLMKG